MGNKKSYIINQIVKYSQKLDLKGFGANHDGNISAKYDDVLLATPTAVSKGDIVPEIIITLDMQGNKIEGLGKPFSEIKLHLAAYKARSDINAVVHAHPPFATARGLLNLPLKSATPEAVVSIGDITPVVAFAMPGAKENDAIIMQAVAEYNVFMLPGNGVIAVGDCIEQAYLRLELVEHLAKIDYYARTMGTPMELNPTDMNSLLEKRAAIGLDPKTKTAKSQSAPNNRVNPDLDLIKNLIASEIKSILQDN